MPTVRYRCVPVPAVVAVGQQDVHARAVQEYERIINEVAAEGWEYVGTDAVESHYQPGCLHSLLGSIPILSLFVRGQEHIRFKLIVFRRMA